MVDMSLYTMLTTHRVPILTKCRAKISSIFGAKTPNAQLDEGLTTLYEELMEVLRISLDDSSQATRDKFVTDTITASASRQHAQESYRHGYTVSQLVHGYGCICQGITEFAHETHEPITAAEFSQLNLCLDVAIAQAVSEFESMSLDCANRSETLRLGFLVHELRNYLSSAIMAHDLISNGGVAAAGATSGVLSNAHSQMKNIIDRAVAEVRMGGERVVEMRPMRVLSLVSEIESSASQEASARSVTLSVEADPDLEVMADRHLMASALANLVQNAITFTKPGSVVLIRSFAEGEQAVIEIEDHCGGIPENKMEGLLSPFDLDDLDHSKAGLGLSIALRAVELNLGKLSVDNHQGVGCVFSVRVPILRPTAASETALPPDLPTPVG